MNFFLSASLALKSQFSITEYRLRHAGVSDFGFEPRGPVGVDVSLRAPPIFSPRSSMRSFGSEMVFEGLLLAHSRAAASVSKFPAR